MEHHLHNEAIMSMAKMVVNSGNSKPVGNSKDRTPQWVRTTISRVEESLAENISKIKHKEPQFKRFLVRNKDLDRYEVHENGYFGRSKLIAAAEYRKEVEHYL